MALEFCTYHTRGHTQLDVDPWEVERAYAALEGTPGSCQLSFQTHAPPALSARCSHTPTRDSGCPTPHADRFGLAVQPAKQAALGDLRARFEARLAARASAARVRLSTDTQPPANTRACACPGDTTTHAPLSQDTGPAVLSLLLSLSSQPLRSVVDPVALEGLLTRCDAAEDRRRRAEERQAGSAGVALAKSAVQPGASRAVPEDVDSDGMGTYMAPLSDGDTLSEWSDDEGGADGDRMRSAPQAARPAGQQGARGVAPAKPPPGPRARDGAAAGVPAKDWLATAVAAVLCHTLQPSDGGGPTIVPASSSASLGGGATQHLTRLLPRHKAALEAGLSGGQRGAGPVVVTEQALVRDALRALQGWPSEYFPATKRAPAAVALPHLSAGSTGSACACIGAAVTQGALMDAFCAAAVSGEGRSVGPTVTALARSLQRQALDARHRICDSLQQRLDAPYSAHGGACEPMRAVTLLEVTAAADALHALLAPLARLRDVAAPMALLARCGCTPATEQQAGGTASSSAGGRVNLYGSASLRRDSTPPPTAAPLHPRHASAGDAAHCLSALWAAVCAAADGHLADEPAAGPRVTCPSWPLRCALITFVDASAPVLGSVHALLADGSLDGVSVGVAQEAPVEAGPGMACLDDDPATGAHADVSRFWEDAVVSRPAGALPSFLCEVAPLLVVAAKSRRLVRHAARVLHVPGAEVQADGEEGTLHEHMCARLAATLAEPDDAGSWLDDTLADAAQVSQQAAIAAQADADAVAAAEAAAWTGLAWAGALGGAPSSPHDACMSTLLPPVRPTTAAVPSRQEMLTSWLGDPTRSALTCPPPGRVLLETCVLAELRSRCSAASQAALHDLRVTWRLHEELDALHALFLGGCAGFASQMCEQLTAVAGDADAVSDKAPRTWHAVASALDNALGAWSATDEALSHMKGRVFVVPAPLPAGRGPATPGGADRTALLAASAPDPMAGVRVLCRVRWPLGVVVTSADCERYGRTFAHLLSLRVSLAACDLAAAQRRRPRGAQGSTMRDALVTQVGHLLRSLHAHVSQRVLTPALARLTAGLDAAGDVDAARSCHAAFLAEVQRGAWVTPDALWTLLQPQVRVVQGVAAQLCGEAHSHGDGVSAAQLQELQAGFDGARDALLATLRGKLQAGGTALQVAECEALIERLDGAAAA